MKHIKMPKYGLQQDEGTVVKWIKQVGDRIEEGDILCELETDKAMFDFEATDTGYLRQVLCEEGQTVPVLADIAIITDTADEPLEGAPSQQQQSSQKQEPEAEVSAPAPATAPSIDISNKIRRSPAARRLADELGIDLATIEGTGPGGRITKEDVRRVADAAPTTATSAPQAGREPLSRIRKAIAKTMVAAKQTIPHFYLSMDIDLTDAEAWWKQAVQDGRQDLTLTDVIIRAAADALADYPILNAYLESEDIVYNAHVNVGLAVGMDEGLLVPVIAAADTKSLTEITQLRSRIVNDARNGKLTSEAAATFTISNLGMFGIREFSAIINPPECAALAVGTIRDEVQPSTDPIGFLARRMMTVTLSADHRLVDGLVCARYLNSLKTKLEDTSWL